MRAGRFFAPTMLCFFAAMLIVEAQLQTLQAALSSNVVIREGAFNRSVQRLTSMRYDGNLSRRSDNKRHDQQTQPMQAFMSKKSVEPHRGIRRRKHTQNTQGPHPGSHVQDDSPPGRHAQTTDSIGYVPPLSHHMKCCDCGIEDLHKQKISSAVKPKKQDFPRSPAQESATRREGGIPALDPTKQRFYIAAFLPFPASTQENTTTTDDLEFNLSSAWNGLLSAVRYVNRGSNMLENTELCLDLVHTPCGAADAVRSYFEQIYRRPQTLAVIGPSCYDVARTLTQAVQWWDVVQLSFNLDDIELSNRDIYPTFIRTIPDIHAQLNYNHFLSILDDAGVRVGESLKYVLGSDLGRLNKSRNNVKVFLGTSRAAQQLFCQISQFYPSLSARFKVWIFSGKFADGWWKSSLVCSVAQIGKAISSHILVDVQAPQEFDSSRHVAGRLERGSSQSSTKAFAYDAVLATAVALRENLKAGASLPCAGNASSPDLLFRRRMLCAFDVIDFNGSTGEVSFARGERRGAVYFQQLVNARYVAVGVHLAEGVYHVDGNISWPGGLAPPPATVEARFHVDHLSTAAVCFVAATTSLGILAAIFFLTFNVKYRKNKVVKMTSPNLNNAIGVGCVLAYVAILLDCLESNRVSFYDALCRVRVWLPPCAFTLAFGTMFLKTWRVHEIFTNVTAKRKVIKDVKLFSILGIFLSIDVVILVTWSIVDPMKQNVENVTSEMWREDGSYVIYQTKFCKSEYVMVWMGLVCAYKGVLLVFGLFLAWETRQVALSTLNESKHIGLSVYVTVITCVIGPTASFALKSHQDLAFVSTAVSILLCISATLCLVFIPKMTALRRIKEHPEEFQNLRLQRLARRKVTAGEAAGSVPSAAPSGASGYSRSQNNPSEKQELLREGTELKIRLNQKTCLYNKIYEEESSRRASRTGSSTIL